MSVPAKGDAAMTSVSVQDDGPAVRAELQLPGCGQDRALAAFTAPEVLARWWGQAALTAELVPGGRYDVFFAGIPARMTGRVIRYEPGRALEFSWAWEDHQDPPTTVLVVVAATAAGATLTVEHGPHADDDAGRDLRRQHHEGWGHFLPRIPAALASD
jgi:uncharacterized protein YndB with AHSA1/START domain